MTKAILMCDTWNTLCVILFRRQTDSTLLVVYVSLSLVYRSNTQNHADFFSFSYIEIFFFFSVTLQRTDDIFHHYFANNASVW